MTRALEALVALVAPPACVSCRAPTGAGERLCPRCTRALPWLRRTCPRCALPSHRGRACPAGGAAFRRAWAPLAYEGVARDLVAALKFRAALPVADLMAAHMAANLPRDLRDAITAPRPRWSPGGEAACELPSSPGGETACARPSSPGGETACRGPSSPAAEAACGLPSSPAGEPAACGVASSPAAIIVPVPTVAARRRRRGFDPAGVLAGALARRLGCEVAACLERRDRAARQVGASRRVRRASGRLEFVARAPPPLVVLVDDVYTTGATLDAAAGTLRDAGAVALAALAYARTL